MWLYLCLASFCSCAAELAGPSTAVDSHAKELHDEPPGPLNGRLLARHDVAQVAITFPRAGSRVSASFFPQFAVTVADQASFLKEHGESASICFALGEDAPECVDLYVSDARVTNAPAGHHTLRAWVEDSRNVVLSAKANVSFEVYQEPAPAASNPKPSAPSLIAWYREQISHGDWGAEGAASGMLEADRPSHRLGTHADTTTATNIPQPNPGAKAGEGEREAQSTKLPPSQAPFQGPLTAACSSAGHVLLLAIGVKSAAGNFHRRQAARETWMRSDLGALSGQVCLRFAVGEPSAAGSRDEDDDEVRAALRLEAGRYGDILTGEGEGGLPVEDSYYNLVDKTKAFMAFAVGSLWPFRYLMMADDDVYLRVGELAAALEASAPREALYAGQVWARGLGRPIRPQRDPALPNHLPEEAWPLDTLPPFAIGSHYVLSRDCVEFVVDNGERLRGVGTLEDVSVAVWMLALQVHPQHLEHFTDAKVQGCVDNAVSITSLHPFGVRAAHDNLLAGRPLCHGYDAGSWMGWDLDDND